MRLTIMLGVLAIAMAGCSSEDGGDGSRAVLRDVRDSAGVRIVENFKPLWSSGEGWKLGAEPLFRILGTDGSDSNILIDPTSLDVDESGRIIIADGNQAGWHSILVYDDQGGLLSRVGAEGQGPGKFGQLWWASAYRGDSIIGFDMATNRVSVFGPGGQYVRRVDAPTMMRPSAVPRASFVRGISAAYDDGHFLAYPYGYFESPAGSSLGWLQHELLRLAPGGEPWDTLGTFRILRFVVDGDGPRQVSLSPYPFHALHGSSMYYGLGDSFEIRRYGPLGELELVVRKRHASEPVTDEVKEQFIEWLTQRMSGSVRATEAMIERTRRRVAGGVFVDSLPAFSHGFVDDLGYLWVENYRWSGGVERAPVVGPATWSIFDSLGVWLGDLETAPGLIIRDATRDRVYGFVIDEFDVKEVEVYELTR